MTDYSLDFVKHKLLLEKILRGEVILFTGAGFSIGAKVRKDDIPSSSELINKIISDLLEEKDSETISRIISRKTFQQICQMAINKVTENVFNDFLVRTFKNTTPAKFHYRYNKINWKSIYTLNVDDIIETVYRDTDIEIQEYNTKIQPIEYVGDRILKYYKLHGSVNNKSEGFVFASTQYLNKLTLKDNSYNFIQFANSLYHDTVCMVGTNLNEIDLEVYIEKFNKGMATQLPKEKVFYINRTIYKEDISELERKNIICIQETAESFIDKVIEYANLKKIELNENEATIGVRIVKKIDLNTKLNSLGFFQESNLLSNFDENSILNHKPIHFYTGFEPKWIDIISNSDAILINTEMIINDISDNNTFNIFLLLGKSGNGKTTSLHRIINNYSSNSDFVVISHNQEKELNDETSKELSKTINRSDKKFILVFDDGSWSFNFISNVYKDLDETKSVSIVISSRIPEYYREMRNLNNIPNSIYNFDENICKENAKRIILKLKEKGYLGDLARFHTLDNQIEHFLFNIKKEQNDLFTCLINSTEGAGHYSKLNRTIESNMLKKDNALFLVVLAIFDSFGSYPLPLQLFFNIFEKDIVNLRLIVEECSDLLNHNHLEDYEDLNFYVKPRGQFVTSKIKLLFKKQFQDEDLFDISRKILVYLSTNFNINSQKSKNVYTQITHSLLISKLYYKNFGIKDKEIFDDFYHSLIQNFNNNSDFWLQYAKMEMKLKGLASSKIHLEQAYALNPYSYKIKHAIGQWFIFSAYEQKTWEDAKVEFEQGEEVMIEQVRINDVYPVHSYIDGFMLLHRKFRFELETKKIKYLYQLIINLQKEFSNHSLLSLIWKKYYLFLKENNRTKDITITLEELQEMNKIDLSKDAEEQYLI
jgi:ABC-type dipeptide/oligopeptide/nickel transport system ATPase subunit